MNCLDMTENNTFNYKIVKKEPNKRFYIAFSYYKFFKEYLKKDNLFEENNEIKKADYSIKNQYSTISSSIKSTSFRFLICKKYTHSFFSNKYYMPELWNPNKKYKNKYWFCKPNRGSYGIGILILKNPVCICKPEKYVIEESINMKLINNRRWDLRIYVLNRINDGKFETWVYSDGVLRLSPQKFENISQRSMITNTQIYSEGDKAEKLNFCFSKIKNYQLYFERIQLMLQDIHGVFNKKLTFSKKRFKSQFQLLGYDIVFTKKGQPKLLEINTRPDIYKTKPIQTHSKQCMKMMDGMYYDIFNNFVKKSLLEDNNLETNFVKVAENEINFI